MPETKQPTLEQLNNPIYLDIPTLECVDDPMGQGAWQPVKEFYELPEAVKYAADAFHADATGRVRLLAGADFVAHDRIEAAAPAMLDFLRTLSNYPDLCDCSTRGWYGDDHDTQCPLTLAADLVKLATEPPCA